jgi:hypothetical protein
VQIDTSTTVAVTRSVGVDTTRMTLDPEGMAHLTHVLTNLYSDKHLAVLREYSTNALDSHVTAGNPAPIEVTLPGALNPTLVITDHGAGLSRDDIVNVYAKYGASTKRATNNQIGSFGLGAKSAFTIGGQFVVTATKDRRRTVADIALDEWPATMSLREQNRAEGELRGTGNGRRRLPFVPLDAVLERQKKGRHPSAATVLRMLREHDEKAAASAAG